MKDYFNLLCFGSWAHVLRPITSSILSVENSISASGPPRCAQPKRSHGCLEYLKLHLPPERRSKLCISWIMKTKFTHPNKRAPRMLVAGLKLTKQETIHDFHTLISSGALAESRKHTLNFETFYDRSYLPISLPSGWSGFTEWEDQVTASDSGETQVSPPFRCPNLTMTYQSYSPGLQLWKKKAKMVFTNNSFWTVFFPTRLLQMYSLSTLASFG